MAKQFFNVLFVNTPILHLKKHNPIFMKKYTQLSLFYMVMLSLFVLSCNKDKPSKTELITKTSWKFSKATVGGADVTALLEACQKDNVAVFISGGTGTVDEGAMKCTASDPQVVAFTWSFQSNETTLSLSATLFTGGSNLYNIVNLTESELTVSQDVTISGNTQNAIFTFVH